MPPIIHDQQSKLAPELHEKLVRICGLLGSPFDGERAAAGLKASELLRRHGLTWADAIRAAPALPDLRTPHSDVGWRTTVAGCMRRTEKLNSWEVGFLRGLSSFERISQKQAAHLDAIARKCGVAT